MIKIFAILLFGLLLEAVGVVFLSKALKQTPALSHWAVGPILHCIGAVLTNPLFWIGLALETGFFLCLLILMATSPVSFIWPLTSLGFVLTTLAAYLLLGEHVSALRWVGVILIVIGAALVSWSEHLDREQRPPPPPSTMHQEHTP